MDCVLRLPATTYLLYHQMLADGLQLLADDIAGALDKPAMFMA
jgi:hypothetical protein